MKFKLIAVLAGTILSSHATAQPENTNLFKCIDKATLAIDSTCVQTMVSTNNDWNQEFYNELSVKSYEYSKPALATLVKYPETNTIRVIALPSENHHKEATLISMTTTRSE